MNETGIPNALRELATLPKFRQDQLSEGLHAWFGSDQQIEILKMAQKTLSDLLTLAEREKN